MNILAQREASPLVSLRAVFETGSASDPAGAAGTAWLTALQLAGGGTRRQEYVEILESLFPTAVQITSGVDKEMTSFAFETHVDNLETVYSIFRDMLTDPGWREDDFERLRADALNYLTTGLRGQNDEELAKEVLASAIHQDHPYSTPNCGTETALKCLTLDSLKQFAANRYTRDRLTLALAGGYPDGFDKRVESDFAALPATGLPSPAIPPASEPSATTAILVEKPARSVAISFGFPIDVRRGHPDFPALLVATSCLGQHRMSSGRLFTSMRQIRGLNYGDYAYIEHFPGGMFSLEPEPNLGRRSQIFELWIRPVETHQAHFALRLALHELERLIAGGLTEAEFQRTRSFLTKYSRLLLATKQSELGYSIDSRYYGIPPYPDYLRSTLSALTLDDVNAAIRRHLRSDRLTIAAVGPRMVDFAASLAGDTPSPISYT
ncbi:MAG: insulinase family protein, partial [Bryobacteraceae bacterium]|nr:insulinase family protein [Bryobacteraceae bacterium]